jgi:allantoin racemase
MRIRIIRPVAASSDALLTAHVLEAGPGTELSTVSLLHYPPTVESRTDQAMAAPGVIARAIEAQRDGCDAIVIDCMDDPGLQPAREVVSIPVVGSAQASVHIASMLGHRFSIIGTAERDAPSFEDMVRCYRLEARLASVRWLGIPVRELEDAQRVYPEFLRASTEAVGDGAHVIVPGCTLLTGYGARLVEDLAGQGSPGVTVVDPIRCAVRVAEALVALELTHSKRSYPYPGHDDEVSPPEYLSALA